MPIVKETSAPRNPVPEGTHHAICYAVVDLGTQQPLPQSTFPSGPKPKLMFIFELPEERIDLERDGRAVNLPRACSKEFTASLHKKASLRAFLESWRGRKFTEDELKGFDLQNVAGVNCMINVIHNEKGYEQIASIMPLPKGMPKRTPENAIIVYDIAQEVPAILPEWIRKKIQQSDEHLQAAQNGGQHHEPPPSEDVDDDPLPF